MEEEKQEQTNEEEEVKEENNEVDNPLDDKELKKDVDQLFGRSEEGN